MLVWRICRKPYAALDGRGGLHASGRWHTRGRPVVYTSQSLALSALELLVHVDRDLLPSDLVRVEIEVPDELEVSQVLVEDLPGNWHSYPAPSELQELGDAWLVGNRTPVLRVPSAATREEFNFLLNPRHADAQRIEVVSQARFSFDSRLA